MFLCHDSTDSTQASLLIFRFLPSSSLSPLKICFLLMSVMKIIPFYPLSTHTCTHRYTLGHSFSRIDTLNVLRGDRTGRSSGQPGLRHQLSQMHQPPRSDCSPAEMAASPQSPGEVRIISHHLGPNTCCIHQEQREAARRAV